MSNHSLESLSPAVKMIVGSLLLAEDMNGETIAGLRHENTRLRGELARLQKKLDRRSPIEIELEEAVIIDRHGDAVTLWSLLEDERYRGICPTCRDIRCEGCIPEDADKSEERDYLHTFAEWARRTA